MRSDITSYQAKVIVGQIRQRRNKVALFSVRLGIKLKPVYKCSDAEIGSNNFIGIYNKKTGYEQILTDWNETI